MTPLQEALAYTHEWGIAVFPCLAVDQSPKRKRKSPLTPHGFRDASADPKVISQWWGHHWPDALIGMPTGKVTRRWVLDVDVKDQQANGFDTLDDLGHRIPDTPMAHSASGGLHVYFDAGDRELRNSAGLIGPGLDVRGDGGYIIVPSEGSRYFWDPLWNFVTVMPIAAPDWLWPPPLSLAPAAAPIGPVDGLNPYGEAAIQGGCNAIARAGPGQQERTLNAESFSIGTLAGAGAVPEGIALRALLRAAATMPNYDPSYPWRPEEIDAKVRRAFNAGMRHPRGGAVEQPPENWIADDPDLENDIKIERERFRQASHAGQRNGGANAWMGPDLDYVRERVSLDFWCERELPPIDPLLGEFVTTTSRILISGPAGIGKTNILMAATMSLADGTYFLHWRGCGQPRRVLFLDGEMSRRLFKARLEGTARRHGNRPKGFFPFNREDFEDMPPLDTAEGQRYVDHVVAALSPDVIVFDNIMALTIGDLREPESWRKIAPWTRELTRRCIGQIWVHHTGVATDRGYGDSTREWGLDTVALLEKVERPELDIAFKLTFTKARERTPQNRSDFEPTIITLSNERWGSEGGNVGGTGKRQAKDRALTLLIDAVARHGTIPTPCPYIPPDTLAVTVGLWRAACAAGCISEGDEKANRRAFERAAKKLLDLGLIGKHELFVWPVR